MKVLETSLPGVLIVEPERFGDDRGFFLETYQSARYRKEAGIAFTFVQDNHSRSRRGVLRGMHAQKTHPQGKLVRVSRGEVFDVAVDINPHSKTFGHWEGVLISDTNARQLWIPPGYAHGFLALSEEADFEYKCTDFYHPEDEIGIIWSDPDVGIEWPLENPIVAEKDLKLPTLREIRRSR